MGTLAAAALSVNEGAGAVESVVAGGPRGVMCSDFIAHVKVPFSPWDSLSTTVCVTVLGAMVSDMTGTTFPDAKNCTTLDHRRARTAAAPLQLLLDGDRAVHMRLSVC